MTPLVALLAALPLAPQAPAGAWVTEGGSLARDRCTETAPLARRPQLAWRRAPAAERVGEPRVWGAHVVVEEQRGAARALVLLDLETGASVGDAVVLETAVALAPALWDELVVVRSSPRVLEAFELSPRGFAPVWRWDAGGELGEPLLEDRTCYVVAGGSLLAIDVGASGPSWRTSGAIHCFGPLVAGPDDVEALARTPSGRGWRTTRHDRASGEVVGSRYVWPDADGLGDARDAVLCRLDDGVIVWPERPFSGGWGQSVSIAVTGESTEASGGTYTGTHLDRGVAVLEDECLVRVRAPASERVEARNEWIVAKDLRGPGERLAGGGWHDALLAGNAPAAIAGRTAYLGGIAVDLDTLDIAWHGGFRGAVLPVQDGVLHLVPDGALELWRAPQPSGTVAYAAGAFPAAIAGWSDAGARARFADGTAWQGALALVSDGDTIALERRVGRAAERAALASLDVLLDASGAVVWTSGPRALVRGVEREAAAAAADALLPAAKAILATRDLALVERLAAELARWRPGDAELAKDVEGKRSRLARGRRKDAPEPSDAALVAALDDLASLPRRHLAAALAALPESAREEAGPTLVRRLLELDARDVAAWEWIAARAPVDPASTVASDEWLAFIEAARRVPIAIRRAPTGQGDGLPAPDRRLGGIARFWRPDVVAYDTKRLCVVSTLERPGAVAAFAARTELFLDALESLLAPFPVVRRDGEKLEVQLAPTREDYAKIARLPPASRERAKLWSIEYDPRERVTYAHVPAGADAFELAPDEFGAALGLHWLDELCPAVEHHTARVGAKARPGLFLVVGFLHLADSLELDVQSGTYRFGARPDPRLDELACTPVESWLSWEELLALDGGQAIEMPEGADRAASSHRRLADAVQLTAEHLFHAQSSAAMTYLLAREDGADRRAAAALLLSWFHAHPDGFDLAKALGREPAELGAEIERWVLARLGPR